MKPSIAQITLAACGAVAVILFGLALSRNAKVVEKPEPVIVGGTQVIGSTYFGATNTSTTITSTATTTNPILSLDANRTNATVCYVSGTSTLFMHQQSESTTTLVKVNAGIPLYSSSTQVQTCQDFPGFKGYLIGISSAQPIIVSVSSWK